MSGSARLSLVQDRSKKLPIEEACELLGDGWQVGRGQVLCDSGQQLTVPLQVHRTHWKHIHRGYCIDPLTILT